MKFRPSNRQKLATIATYLSKKLSCSMGEIEEQLGISIQNQYNLFRAYKEFFPGLELSKGRWAMTYEPIAAIPATDQDVLSAK